MSQKNFNPAHAKSLKSARVTVFLKTGHGVSGEVIAVAEASLTVLNLWARYQTVIEFDNISHVRWDENYD